MARGAQSKQEIFNKMLATFEGSFMQDDKILRIPWNENGEILEIKVSLTAAKDIIGAAAPSSSDKVEEFNWEDPVQVSPVEAAAAAHLEEDEKERIKRMMTALGMV